MAIESQVLADFVTGLADDDKKSGQGEFLTLYVDGASNIKGSETCTILENNLKV